MQPILKLAIQKSGRLSETSIAMLNDCGIHVSNHRDKLTVKAANFPVEFLFLRDDDIPGYVTDGVTDVGIVGENMMVEKNKEVALVEKLGFAKCRLCIAVPNAMPYQNLNDLSGKNIATSYPHILGKYLKEKNVKAHIHEISGSVEIAPNIGLADAIFDIVSSGSTLMSNGLKEVETVMHSEAILIAAPALSDEKKKIVEELLFRLKAVMAARDNKYILLNAPNDSVDEIIKILPGMKSPTVLPLAMEGWSSLHSVVNENDFWKVIKRLKKAGAEGILVVPIEKMIL